MYKYLIQRKKYNYNFIAIVTKEDIALAHITIIQYSILMILRINELYP